MKVANLIRILSELDNNDEVMILDGFNGGGFPREINYQKSIEITDYDAHHCADCEDMIGRKVFVIGYGSY